MSEDEFAEWVKSASDAELAERYKVLAQAEGKCLDALEQLEAQREGYLEHIVGIVTEQYARRGEKVVPLIPHALL